MRRRSIALFSMLGAGHLKRSLPIISGLSRRQIAVAVHTHSQFQGWIEHAGGTFVDMFGKYPLEEADAESIPFATRYVTYAGRYGGDLLRDVAQMKPDLVIYDSFAVIGYVVGRSLGVPFVNVCAGHNVNPRSFPQSLQRDIEVRLSSRCLAAVEELRERFNLDDASPFSYVSTQSPFLNIYGEPPEFLDPGDRSPFEPLAFYGSIQESWLRETSDHTQNSWFPEKVFGTVNVYVSFGTVIWRYYAAEAVRTLRSIVDWAARRNDMRMLVSLGGWNGNPDLVSHLERWNVRVEPYVDQGEVLRSADVIVTHHGLNSTHEAAFNRVPMISYPFFWDQPSLARKCQDLGLAIPLTDSLRGPVQESDLGGAFEIYRKDKASLEHKLESARCWEEQVIGQREQVLDRILGLI